MEDQFYEYIKTIRCSDPSYIERTALTKAYSEVKAGRTIYILTARKEGKSTLCKNLHEKLVKEDGYSEIYIDLQAVDENMSEDDFFYDLSNSIRKKLNLQGRLSLEDKDFQVFWRRQQDTFPSSPRKWLMTFIEDIVLERCSHPMLITFDEVDSLTKLPNWTDGLFLYIRECVNKKNGLEADKFRLLNFAIVGLAKPRDLIRDGSRTAFNNAQEIVLSGFSLKEAMKLKEGLKNARKPEALIREIYEWTEGQPFLAQKICSLVSQRGAINRKERELVKDVVLEQIINAWKHREYDNPEFFNEIENIFFRSPHVLDMLIAYRRILESGGVPEESSEALSDLKLTGLVKVNNRRLVVYNRIYKEIFDSHWIDRHLSLTFPSEVKLNAWIQSNEKEEHLLTLSELNNAEKWMRVAERWDKENKNSKTRKIKEVHKSYIRDSQARKQKLLQNAPTANSSKEVCILLDDYRSKLEKISHNCEALTEVILKWVGCERELLTVLLDWIFEEYSEQKQILKGKESEFIEKIVQNNLILMQEADFSPEKLNETSLIIDDKVREYFYKKDTKIREIRYASARIVELYERIYQGYNYTDETGLEGFLSFLVTQGFVTVNDEKDIQVCVSNLFYRYFFNQSWIDRILQSKFIGEYEVMKEIHA